MNKAENLKCSFNSTKSVSYTFKSVPIIGGGFVTGLLFHPTEKGLIYARTDVGTAYRLQKGSDHWVPLYESKSEDGVFGSPLSIAVDRYDADRLYMACGSHGGQRGKKHGYLAVSHDRGNSFLLRELPAEVNANCIGRGAGERLLSEKGRILFASARDGLLISDDDGKSWNKTDVCGEKHFYFIFKIPQTNTILLGCTGEDKAKGTQRGCGLFVSYDFANSFQPLEFQGYAATRAAFDGKYVYAAFNCGRGQPPESFTRSTCDCGKLESGRLIRFEAAGGRLCNAKDITPPELLQRQAGIGGITANEKYVAFSTVCSRDKIMLSFNSGESFNTVIDSKVPSNYRCHCSYMKPEHNNGATVMHWVSSLESDPFDPDTAFFNTGTGVFRIKELLSGKPYFEDFSFGIEETVHMNVYSPPSEKVVLLDAVGDLGGFAFTDPEKPCENTFTDENGNRLITVINIDYCDSNPDIAVCTPRGNWKGTSKGGAAVSLDGGINWRRCVMPYGISEDIDLLCSRIEMPNVNSGWIAITADGKNLVWTLCDRFRLPAAAVVYSTDMGRSWNKSRVTDMQGKEITGFDITLKPMADRVDGNIVYGFGNDGTLFLSVDGGKSFSMQESPLPAAEMGLSDGIDHTEIRCVSGKKGVAILALEHDGLWRLKYKDGFSAERITPEGVTVLAQGMGKEAEGCKYKTIYIYGNPGGRYGLWRSVDNGVSWCEIKGDSQRLGQISSLCGDMKRFGRVYAGTAGRGLFIGDETDCQATESIDCKSI